MTKLDLCYDKLDIRLIVLTYSLTKMTRIALYSVLNDVTKHFLLHVAREFHSI